MSSLYRRIRNRKTQRSDERFLQFKRDHTQSFASTGERCGCGREHNSIDILDESGEMIEARVCPFMYNVRNACLRGMYGKHIPKVDSSLLQEVSKL